MAERITLAVPFVSNAPLLQRTLESIVKQSDRDWEAVVVNNASDVREREAGASVASSYLSIQTRYHLNSTHLGQSENYNRCLELAQTELVCIVHSDDELLTNFVGDIRALMSQHPDAAAGFVPVNVIDAASRPCFSFPDFIKRFLVPRGNGDIVLRGEGGLRSLMRGNYIFSPASAFRKSQLGALCFDTGLRQAMDLDLWANILFANLTIVGSRRPPAYAYRRHRSQVTATLTKTLYRFQEEALVFDRISDRAQNYGWASVARVAAAKMIVRLHLILLSFTDIATGRVAAAFSKLQLARALSRKAMLARSRSSA